MVQAYNFLASWQLFPEKGSYELGERPRSGTYRIHTNGNEPAISMEANWVNIQGQAFSSRFTLIPDGQLRNVEYMDSSADVVGQFLDGSRFETRFTKGEQELLHLLYEIMPNGYLRITHKSLTPEGQPYVNVEFYHKQMSVLPYAASVSGAVIKPTEEGVIRHKSLTAMEEQTNMQLEQIRKQIELLALQAREIHSRKELSLIIYGARLNFSPVIGHTYHLYEKHDDTHLLSMISPVEWGGGAGPFKRCIASVKLLADHTWTEVI